jgi:tetratricopeptide (TPR) repeat protein
MSLVAALVLAPVWVMAASRPRPPVESLAGWRQAYLCTTLTKDEAVAACRAALSLQISPERTAIVYSVLALTLCSLQRWEEAVEAYRQLTRLRPTDAEGHWRLGDALLFGLNQPEEAMLSYREALRLAPDLMGVHVSLATALSMRGDVAERSEEHTSELQSLAKG